MARLLPAIAIPLLLCGCGAGSRSASVVRDSAGIRIVENHAPKWSAATQWRLAVRPSLSIGVQQGNPHYELARVVGALRPA